MRLGLIAGSESPHFGFEDAPEVPFVIGLRHENSHFLRGTTRCRFLVEGEPDAEHPLGQARCGIHRSRPSACRTFPTRLNGTGELAVAHDVPARGRGRDHAAYELCPREWTPSDFDPVDAVQDLVVARYEMAFFRRLADGWNRRPGPWEAFLGFLRLIYEHRLSRDTRQAG